MSFEHFERGYLLPKGCKDLSDVIDVPPQAKVFPKASLPHSEPIPVWRIALYALLLMTGVNFLGQPEGHPILGWLCVVFAGAFIAVYCVWLNWTQTARAHKWFLENSGSIRRIRALFFLPRLLVWLRGAIVRRRR